MLDGADGVEAEAESGAALARGAGISTAQASSGRVNSNTEPWPGTDAQRSSPPIARASSREIVSPSPAPSRRARGSSARPACSNGAKMRSSWSAGMPSPVSLTAKRSSVPARMSSTDETSTSTLPWSVNLIALPTRLCSTCWMREASPIARAGNCGATVIEKSRPLARAVSPSRRPTSPATSRRSKGRASTTSLPDSMRARSRMSFTSVSRWRPERRTISTCSRCCGLSSPRSSSWVMPMMPFSGVRISWLITATKRLLLLLVSSAASSARRRCSASRACSKRSRSSSSARASMRRDSSTVSSQNIVSPPALSQPVVPPCRARRIANGAITSEANSACPRAQ